MRYSSFGYTISGIALDRENLRFNHLFLSGIRGNGFCSFNFGIFGNHGNFGNEEMAVHASCTSRHSLFTRAETYFVLRDPSRFALVLPFNFGNFGSCGDYGNARPVTDLFNPVKLVAGLGPGA